MTNTVADIKTSCPQCKTNLNIPAQYAGKQGRCSTCKTVFTVPEVAGADVSPGGSSKEHALPRLGDIDSDSEYDDISEGLARANARRCITDYAAMLIGWFIIEGTTFAAVAATDGLNTAGSVCGIVLAIGVVSLGIYFLSLWAGKNARDEEISAILVIMAGVLLGFVVVLLPLGIVEFLLSIVGVDVRRTAFTADFRRSW